MKFHDSGWLPAMVFSPGDLVEIVNTFTDQDGSIGVVEAFGRSGWLILVRLKDTNDGELIAVNSDNLSIVG